MKSIYSKELASQLDTALRAMPLKEMDAASLSHMIKSDFDDSRVYDAISLATYLHRNQTRGKRGKLPRTQYIEHPLRVTLRLIRYGVTDSDILIAAVLHDTVEDCRVELLEMFNISVSSDVRQQHDDALQVIESYFGSIVREIVDLVSNDPVPVSGLSQEQKRESYRSHVRKSIIHVGAFLVKFSDFVDNAVGLYHDADVKSKMVKHLSAKYAPLVSDFRDGLPRIVHLVPESGVRQMVEHLDHGQKRLDELVQLHSSANVK